MTPELRSNRPISRLTRKITVPGLAESGVIAQTATQAALLGNAVSEGNTTQTVIFALTTTLGTAIAVAVDIIRKKHNASNTP